MAKKPDVYLGDEVEIISTGFKGRVIIYSLWFRKGIRVCIEDKEAKHSVWSDIRDVRLISKYKGGKKANGD